MTREEIIEAIQHDNMMPFLQDWEARDVVDFVLKNIQPSLPEGLDEAAEEHMNNIAFDNEFDKIQCIRDFKAGAEWMKKQLLP